MTKTWFDIDGTVPAVGIYTGNDDAPLYDPAAYIGTRTKFSTLLNYIPFVPAKKISATINVPGIVPEPNRTSMRRILVLGAHGMPGIPFVYGFVTVSGIILPMCGAVPVKWNTTFGDVIHWTLGVDATNVFIYEDRSYYAWPSGANVPIEVYVSDKVI